MTKDAASVPTDTAEDQAGQWVLRRVASNGVVTVDNQMFSVGNSYKSMRVDVFVDDTTIQVGSQNHLIKIVPRLRKGPVRKFGADGLHRPTSPEHGVKDQLTLGWPTITKNPGHGTYLVH